MASRSVDGEQSTQLKMIITPCFQPLMLNFSNELGRTRRHALEILPFQFDLTACVREQIEFMEETMEEKSIVGIDPLSVSLYQIDLDRTLVLFRSYLRIRIFKVNNHRIRG
ncbi:unnamed protein product [Lathyrus sativus]|nr:unnamed protein product [Lathyrus sativus]